MMMKEDQVPESHLLRLIEKHISFAHHSSPFGISHAGFVCRSIIGFLDQALRRVSSILVLLHELDRV